MNVTIVGLGYVGLSCAAFFLEGGHRVVGVEKNEEKNRLLRRGEVPFKEPDIEQVIRRGLAANEFVLEPDLKEAAATSDIVMVAVGTPTNPAGRVDLTAVRSVVKDLAERLSSLDRPLTVVLRSTVPPGTTDDLTQLLCEGSGLEPGRDVFVAFNPEFLREGSALADFRDPPFTVIGTRHGPAADRLRELYKGIHAPIRVMPPPAAELLKYACNGFHAVKIAFANEIAALAGANGIDPEMVMSTFVLDEKLNISSKYLRPGFAFGGSCLPKDLRGLNGLAEQDDLKLPLIASVLRSNDELVERTVRAVQDLADVGGVLMMGATFKPGTDDLRESPYLRLVRRLLDSGASVRLVEPGVDWDRITGANRAFVDGILPELGEILLSPEDAQASMDWAVVLVSRRDKTFEGVRVASVSRGVPVLDLGGVNSALSAASMSVAAGS